MTTATQAEYAAMLGKDKSYVTRLKQAGRLVLSDGGLVDVEASNKRITDTSDPGKGRVVERHAAARGDGQGKQQGSDAIGNSYQTARAVKEKYAALTAKADYERAIGKLIDKDEVISAMDDLVSFARQGVENLPHRVAAQLVGKDFDQIMALLKQEVIGMMGDMHKEAGKQLAELTKVDA